MNTATPMRWRSVRAVSPPYDHAGNDHHEPVLDQGLVHQLLVVHPAHHERHGELRKEDAWPTEYGSSLGSACSCSWSSAGATSSAIVVLLLVRVRSQCSGSTVREWRFPSPHGHPARSAGGPGGGMLLETVMLMGPETFVRFGRRMVRTRPGRSSWRLLNSPARAGEWHG